MITVTQNMGVVRILPSGRCARIADIRDIAFLCFETKWRCPCAMPTKTQLGRRRTGCLPVCAPPLDFAPFRHGCGATMSSANGTSVDTPSRDMVVFCMAQRRCGLFAASSRQHLVTFAGCPRETKPREDFRRHERSSLNLRTLPFRFGHWRCTSSGRCAFVSGAAVRKQGHYLLCGHSRCDAWSRRCTSLQRTRRGARTSLGVTRA